MASTQDEEEGEEGPAGFRELKTVYEKEDLVKKAIPPSSKYKNKQALMIFNLCQSYSGV